MASTIREIRHRKREQRLRDLRRDAATALANQPSSSLWLFGSWARGDWDSYSDVDVLALSEQEWQARRNGDDPYWRAIGRDALRLSAP